MIYNIRPLEPGDAAKIADIASQYNNFTMPSDYIVWMLSQTQDEFCLVMEKEPEGIIGYVLSIPTATPGELFVWQLAIKPFEGKSSTQSLRRLFSEANRRWRARGINRIWFTVSNEKRLRLIARLAKGWTNGTPELRGKFSPEDYGEEQLYMLDL